MGIYVVIGASLLGALSCMLIAWSLWTRSQVRKRARQRQLATGQHAAIPVSGAYPTLAPGHTVVASASGSAEEPRTEFMSSADLFGEVGAPDEPTQFLSEADLYAAEPEDEHEAATAFMTEEELFAEQQAEDEHEAATAFMTEEELFAERQREAEDEHEAATACMTDEELFGEADDEDEIPTSFMTTDELFGRPRARVDATVVLTEDAVIPEPEPLPPRAPDRPPVHRMPQAPVGARKPAPLKPTLPGPKPEPPASRYTGFVGDGAGTDDDDDDDDFDANDPETELVHQAELLRLINPKRSQ